MCEGGPSLSDVAEQRVDVSKSANTLREEVTYQLGPLGIVATVNL